jgi:hypothetical protein
MKPLDLHLDFEDRAYRLREAIDVSIRVMPLSTLELREVRVELVCDQIYTESRTVSGIRAPSPSSLGGTDRLPSVNATDTKVNSFVHSRVSVPLTRMRMEGEVPTELTTKLNIGGEAPPMASEAKKLIKDSTRGWSFKWKIVVTADAVRGRNPRRQRKVDIAF